MSTVKYSIGIDYGTLSGRAILADITNGSIAAEAVYDYPHAVSETSEAASALTGVPTEVVPGTALQHPGDYLGVLEYTIPELLKKSGASADDIVGIGIDFTSCTPMPVKRDGTPLCMLDGYKDNIHSYVKLWKHHGAIKETEIINERASAEFLRDYGGSVSCEAIIPKLWEVCRSAPEVYSACELFVEAGDWIIHELTGNWVGSSCMAGYKAFRTKENGYPSDLIASLEGMENAEAKLLCDIRDPGTPAGTLTEKAARLTGLKSGIPVAAAIIDAHSCVPGAGIDKPGNMLAIIGTSACYMLLGDTKQPVDGICGVVDGGILPGYYGYEAGQCCMGDHFQWFVDNCVPKSYYDEADARGIDIHALLCEKASQLSPGSGTADSSPLIALDWWNGNRSVLNDHTLSGMMLGMTITTKPEQLYRALIEATAYGARMIIETFRNAGIPIDSLTATGGIPQKNELLDRIYADVLGIPVSIAACPQCGAMGAAMLGAYASGIFGSIGDAISAMGAGSSRVYTPDKENSARYDKLYAEYKTLHDYFGRGENDVMKRLRNI